MTPFLRKLLGLNWLLALTMLALAIFGVVAIYSATYMRQDPVASEFWRKQASWVAVGFLAFMVTSLIDYRWVKWGALPMYLAGLFFLILTRFIGTKVYGSRSWLHLGPINFQPAQLAIVAGIMVVALFLSQFRQMHPMLRLTLSVCVASVFSGYRFRGVPLWSDRRVLSVGNLYIDAKSRFPADLVRRVQPLLRLADQLELRGIL